MGKRLILISFRITNLDIPRIYEKKEKRSLMSGIRNQIQSRKKQNSKVRTLGNELFKKPNFKKSEYILKKNKFNDKHSRSFRRKNSQDQFDLKNSFQKSNESFYQKKKNQSLVGNVTKPKQLNLEILSLDKKFKNELMETEFIDFKNLDKVSENEDEDGKFGSQNSHGKNPSQSLSIGDAVEFKERSCSYDDKKRNKHTSLRGGLKRTKGGKLIKMCIYAKKQNKMVLPEDNSSNKKHESQMIKNLNNMGNDEGYKEETKFLTLKKKSKNSNINEELKILYHKRKQGQQSHSLNSSQKQITSRLGGGLESRPLAESKMIDSKLGSFEDQNYIRPGKMASSLAVMKNSKNGKMMMGKNYSMFQERKMERKMDNKQLSNLHTPRISKHDLVKNLYQPEGHAKKYLASHLQEFNWPISHLNKSRDKIRESMKEPKQMRIHKKNLLKNSKKRNQDKSSGLCLVDTLNKKTNNLKRYKNSIKPKIKKYAIKRMEQTEVRKAVMKDHQNQKANYEKIIKNFSEGRPDKKKRISHSNHSNYEPKFKKNKNSKTEYHNEKVGYHEVVHSLNHDMYIQQVMNTSVNNHRTTNQNEESESEELKKSERPKQKKYKTSVQKDAKMTGYSQREIIVPKDFRIFNNKVRSGEGFDLKREYIGHKESSNNKESFRSTKGGVFKAVNEKFKNMKEGFEEKMNQKKTQLFNKRTLWRDKLMTNPISCMKKTPGLRYTKSKKKLNKPALKALVGKMKHSFLNKHKFETDLDKKLTRTNKKGPKDFEKINQSNKSKKQSIEVQNKPGQKEKTMTKVKSKMKLGRMLKNRNLNQNGKNKINLSSQFKVLKKSVGKNNFNKEQELEDDKKKFLKNFRILQYLGKGSYAKVHMAYDKGIVTLLFSNF
jgi:hypothetical protein